MKFGADRKRLAFLGLLVLVGGYVVYSNLAPDSAPSPAVGRGSPTAGAAAPAARIEAARAGDRRRGGVTRATEWKPAIGGEPLDPQKVDPTLRLDLLAKVQRVELSGAQRNLFQFGDTPKAADATPLQKVEKIHTKPTFGPTPPPAPPPPAAKPTAPPIALKYYGYASPRSSPRKRAFFLDGDLIIVAGEGELIEKRYRLIKIGVNSVTMEDTQFQDQQTLPLAAEAAG